MSDEIKNTIGSKSELVIPSASSSFDTTACCFSRPWFRFPGKICLTFLQASPTAHRLLWAQKHGRLIQCILQQLKTDTVTIAQNNSNSHYWNKLCYQTSFHASVGCMFNLARRCEPVSWNDCFRDTTTTILLPFSDFEQQHRCLFLILNKLILSSSNSLILLTFAVQMNYSTSSWVNLIIMPKITNDKFAPEGFPTVTFKN